MYIKLNFTADKPLNYIFRIVNECINNSAITSIATLVSTAATATAWHSSLLANLDTTNSEIIRTGTGVTGLTSNTVSRYARNGVNTTYDDEHSWTVEFSNYDDSTKKQYVNFYNSAGAGNYVSLNRVANGLNSGTLSALTNFAPSGTPNTSTNGGTAATFNAGVFTNVSANYIGSSTSGFTNIRSFFMYISDTCMIWSATCGTTYNVGFGGTYSDSTKYIGPFIFSQYTRFDYTNTNNNGITPMLFTNIRGVGQGFGALTNDWTTVENTMYSSTNAYIAFRVFNLVNTYPTTGASFPIINQPYVNWGIGSRYTDYAGLTASANGAGTISNPTYGPVIFTTVSTRFPSADLKSLTYGMLPVSWRNLYYYNAGGDASARGGWYLFNGDYFPGDEYTYGGKTYKILPTWTGYSSRVGIAIPKE